MPSTKSTRTNRVDLNGYKKTHCLVDLHVGVVPMVDSHVGGVHIGPNGVPPENGQVGEGLLV
jgi:hypothetical protein